MHIILTFNSLAFFCGQVTQKSFCLLPYNSYSFFPQGWALRKIVESLKNRGGGDFHNYKSDGDAHCLA